jgi:hypothetical protein
MAKINTFRICCSETVYILTLVIFIFAWFNMQ